MCARPPLPHRGYRIGVRYDECPLRLTGENRYPWWGDSGGTAPTSSGSVAEGAPNHPGPTMDTASGCGKTVGGVGTASGCGTTTTSIVLPAKERHPPTPKTRHRPTPIGDPQLRNAMGNCYVSPRVAGQGLPILGNTFLKRPPSMTVEALSRERSRLWISMTHYPPI